MKFTNEQIAEICHENNRAYCHAFGDYSQPAWKYVPQEIKDSIVNGVEFHLKNPDASPEASHKQWVKIKLENKWKVGPVKDVAKKEHPNLRPYSELSDVERGKDIVFSALVNTLKGI
jgi:hypothetical protein